MSNNNNAVTLSAHLSGPVLTLGNVPDEVFASGAMGEGLAIDPLNSCLHAPCDGEIIHVARTGHVARIGLVGRAGAGGRWRAGPPPGDGRTARVGDDGAREGDF